MPSPPAIDTTAASRFLRRNSTSSNRDAADQDDAEQGLLAVDKSEYRDEPGTPRMPPSPTSKSHRRQSCLRRTMTVAPWVIVGMILAWMLSAMFFQVKPHQVDVTILRPQGQDKEPEQVKQSKLPDTPVPVIIDTVNNTKRWTVSIPSSMEFPMMPKAYSAICEQTKVVRNYLDTEHQRFVHYPYYSRDEKFMDITEAENEGVLPTNPVLKYSSSWSKPYDTGNSPADSAGYCKRSMTFVLESPDAGLGNTLMLLWSTYGLAKYENRSFFVDDRNWAFGKYTDFFQPPPDEACLPPPEHHKLPCPHYANHLVVSRATQAEVFGHAYGEAFEDPKKMGVMRKHKIFAMMRVGYEALFHLTYSDQKYLDERVNATNAEVREKGGVEVGLHIRRGDRHPREGKFRDSYIPLERFVDVAWEQAKYAHNETNVTEAIGARYLYDSKMILASDDPLVYSNATLKMAMRAQDRIILADEPPLDETSFKNETSPWNGGFTAEKFWALGNPEKAKALNLTEQDGSNTEQRRDLEGDTRVQPSTDALRLRAHIARAYLLDLAMLSQTDRVVCTVSSIGCRLLAVMMGWEDAIIKEHWKNVDDLFHWKGIVW